ncbi:hypothetical protein B296_00030318 [Ensete ventricosum]|uniref:Uncharacterized protein n=1 Tax=Ensete ventricosum TaxID=4639 RepID=A0A426ZQN8_ENSVE|nr:hypothetical protein B296_00030318 [Ensete ventricosum]
MDVTLYLVVERVVASPERQCCSWLACRGSPGWGPLPTSSPTPTPETLKEKKKKMRRRKPYIPTLLLFARHRESEEDLTRLSLFTKYGRSTVLTSEFLLFSAPHFAFFGDLSSFHDPCRERRRAEW